MFNLKKNRDKRSSSSAFLIEWLKKLFMYIYYFYWLDLSIISYAILRTMVNNNLYFFLCQLKLCKIIKLENTSLAWYLCAYTFFRWILDIYVHITYSYFNVSWKHNFIIVKKVLSNITFHSFYNITHVYIIHFLYNVYNIRYINLHIFT